MKDYVFPMFRANAIYEGTYLLGTSIARPLIAKRQIEIAREVGADAVCHGATGKGNDQVRFELGYYGLKPDVKVIAPWLLTKDSYRLAFAHIFFFETIIVFIVWSHLKCMLSDPGTLTHFWSGKQMEKIENHMERYLVARASGSGQVSRPWCAKCDNYKPVHTHHCSYCGTCIEGFDHHCPWMNNCVGKRNHKFFMLFLLYVGSGSGYAIVMTVYRMWSCMKVSPVMARAMDVSFFFMLLICLGIVCYQQRLPVLIVYIPKSELLKVADVKTHVCAKFLSICAKLVLLNAIVQPRLVC